MDQTKTIRLSPDICVCGATAGLHYTRGGVRCIATCSECSRTWYVYHCWNRKVCAGAQIDSRFDRRCEHDLSYVCSVCGQCRCTKPAGRSVPAVQDPQEDLTSLEAIAGIAFNGDVDAAAHWLEKDR